MKDFEAIKNGQDAMHEKIRQHAQELGLIKQKPVLEPIYDGVADIEGYLSTSPKIMWILKEPWGESTPAGRIRGGDWSLTDHFLDNNVWKHENMWKVMIQINHAIHTNQNWRELDYIDGNQEMIDELKRTAYINLSKMPAETSSPSNHLELCYPMWKDIVFEQIDLYEPDIIIFGATFPYFRDDLQITSKPIHTESGKWFADTYLKDNRILVDAYHPSRKGGENGSKDYVTSVVNAIRKATT